MSTLSMPCESLTFRAQGNPVMRGGQYFRKRVRGHCAKHGKAALGERAAGGLPGGLLNKRERTTEPGPSGRQPFPMAEVAGFGTT